ncbi:MAG: NUDIX hydrolase [archaeon]
MNYKNPLLATDIIIQYEQKEKSGIILIKRKNPPYGLAIPGGFAEYGLSLEDNARKEAKEETGLDIIIKKDQQPFLVCSNPERDPRTHVVSVVYVAKGKGFLRAGDDAKDAMLYSLDEIRALSPDAFAFDHYAILKAYLDFLEFDRDSKREEWDELDVHKKYEQLRKRCLP